MSKTSEIAKQKWSVASGTAVEILGDFAASFKFSDLPPDDQTRVKLRFLHNIGCALAGRDHITKVIGRDIARQWQGPGKSSFWWSDFKGSAEDCAAVNCIFTGGANIDDSFTHTGPIVLPAVLATAEEYGSSGEEVLAAIALGYEITLRIESGYRMEDKITEKGFRHSWPATLGAAIAVAYLMKLPAGGIADALALATSSCLPPGLMAVANNKANPESEKRIGRKGVGDAYTQLVAMTKMALFAGKMARAGLSGYEMAIEGNGGLYHVHADKPGLPDELFADLGTVWHFNKVGVQPYTAIHAGILYSVEQIVKQHGIKPDEVEHVDLLTFPLFGQVAFTAKGPFSSPMQSYQSFPFVASSTIVFGDGSIDSVIKGFDDPRVLALCQKFEVREREDLDITDFRVDSAFGEATVRLKDGRTFSADASQIPSSLMRPDDWDSMIARFERNAAGLEADHRNAIIDEVRNFERKPDCARIVELLCQAR